MIRFGLTSSVSRKITKIVFWATLWGALGVIQALYMRRNFVAEFHCENASLLVKQRVSVSEPQFVGGLRGNECDSSLAS